MSMPGPAIELRDLHERLGRVEALAGFPASRVWRPTLGLTGPPTLPTVGLFVCFLIAGRLIWLPVRLVERRDF